MEIKRICDGREGPHTGMNATDDDIETKTKTKTKTKTHRADFTWNKESLEKGRLGPTHWCWAKDE